jgi:hypothetical protein
VIQGTSGTVYHMVAGERTESPAGTARRWRGDAEQRRAADRGPAEDELETPLTFKRIFIQELSSISPGPRCAISPPRYRRALAACSAQLSSLASQHLPACPRACALWTHAT